MRLCWVWGQRVGAIAVSVVLVNLDPFNRMGTVRRISGDHTRGVSNPTGPSSQFSPQIFIE